MKKSQAALALIQEALVDSAILTRAVIWVVVVAVAGVLGPRLLGGIVDQALVPRDTAMLWTLLSWYGLIECARLIASRYQAFGFSVLGARSLHRIRVRLYERLLQLPVRRFENQGVGALAARVISDVQGISALFTGGMVRIGERLVTAIAIVVAMAMLDFDLAWPSIVIFLLFSYAAILFQHTLDQGYRLARFDLSRFLSTFTESVQGLTTLHLCRAERERLQQLDSESARLYRSRLAPSQAFAWLHTIMTITIGASVVMILVRGGGLFDAATARSAGVMVSMLAYQLWLFWPVMVIVNEWNVLLTGLAAAYRVYEALGWEREQDCWSVGPIQSMSEAPVRSHARGGFEFESVNFRYGDTEVLHALALRVPAGSVVGVVGPTGSGKSTIVKLLLGFELPMTGVIRLDDQELRQYSLQDLRSRIGVVSQELSLMSGTVRENIDFGGSAGAAAASIVPPEYLDLVVGSGESQLSLGLMQRVAVARGVGRNPDLLILDEATSQLDREAERLVADLIESRRGRTTTLVVAHRLASVRTADQIVVLVGGKIVEQGTHSQLIARHGVYAKMCAIEEGPLRV